MKAMQCITAVGGKGANGYMEFEMVKIKNTWENNFKEEIIYRFTVKGETKDECFRNGYAEERHLRYCNGYYVKFVNPDIQREYNKWLDKNLTVELYYGGGVVD